MTWLRSWSARMPLRIKLVVAMVALVAGGLGVAAVAATTVLNGYLIDRVDDQLQTVQQGPGFRPPGGNHDDGGPGGPGGNQGPLPSEYYAVFTTPSGVSTVYANPLNTNAVPDLP